MLESDVIRDFIFEQAGIDVSASRFPLSEYYVAGLFKNYRTFYRYVSEKEGGQEGFMQVLEAGRAGTEFPVSPIMTSP